MSENIIINFFQHYWAITLKGCLALLVIAGAYNLMTPQLALANVENGNSEVNYYAIPTDQIDNQAELAIADQLPLSTGQSDVSPNSVPELELFRNWSLSAVAILVLIWVSLEYLFYYQDRRYRRWQ